MPTPEREQYDELTAEIKAAERRRDYREAEDLRELRQDVLEVALNPSARAKLDELEDEIQRLEVNRVDLREKNELDRLIAAGAIHKSGPNKGEVNEAALRRAARSGRGIDEIADDIDRRHPGLLAETDSAGTVLDKEDRLFQALQRRHEQRSQTFKLSSARLEAERDKIVNDALDGKQSFETRSIKLNDQPVAVGNAIGRFQNLPADTKRIDLGIQAQRVAPESPTSQKDIRLQREWFKDPTQLDYEGVDTKRRRPVNLLGR